MMVDKEMLHKIEEQLRKSRKYACIADAVARKGVVEEEDKPFICREGCMKRFMSRNSRNQHEKFYCPESKAKHKLHICPYCTGGFASPASLKQHLKRCQVRSEAQQFVRGYRLYPTPFPEWDEPSFYTRAGYLMAKDNHPFDEEQERWFQTIIEEELSE
jgi:uncharacterized Zn-finger protein